MLQIDYQHLTNITPNVNKRTVIRLKWLNLLNSQIKDIYTRFLNEYKEYKFLAQHNYQILSIEHLLNEELNPTINIFITDGDWLNEVFLFYRDELYADDVFIFNESESSNAVFLYSEDEYNNDSIDFYVNISSTDAGLTDQVKSYLDRYVQAGKKYEIIIY